MRAMGRERSEFIYSVLGAASFASQGLTNKQTKKKKEKNIRKTESNWEGREKFLIKVDSCMSIGMLPLHRTFWLVTSHHVTISLAIVHSLHQHQHSHPHPHQHLHPHPVFKWAYFNSECYFVIRFITYYFRCDTLQLDSSRLISITFCILIQ